MTRKNKGFTLIELLVVIAIIGILSAIVLVSLGGARNKAKDVAIKAALEGLRSSAELYSMNNNESYSNFCSSSDVTKVSTNISSNGETMVCNASADAWAASAPLHGGGYWCADSTGVSKSETSALGSATACP